MGYEGEMNEMAMMDMAAPMPSRSMGRIAGGIMPDVYAEDGFDQDAEARKIVKNGHLRLEVADTAESKTLVEKEVEALAGQVTQSNSWQVRNGILGYNLTIRIPAESFETLIGNLIKIGTKLEEGFGTQDITAQYQDTEARLINLQARENSLRDLLAKENDNLSDLLTVDRELWSVRQEIESLQGTQKRRDQDVAYSTLQLSLQPEAQVGDLQNPEWNVKKSWTETINTFKKSLQDLVDHVFRIVGLAPLWIPLLFVVWILKTWIFRRRLTAPTTSKDNFGNPNA